MSDEYTNVLTNVITPVDPRRTDLLFGSLEYVAAEVVVAKIVRKIIARSASYVRGWAQIEVFVRSSVRRIIDFCER